MLALIEVLVLYDALELRESCLEAHVSEVDPPPPEPLEQRHSQRQIHVTHKDHVCQLDQHASSPLVTRACGVESRYVPYRKVLQQLLLEEIVGQVDQ